MSFQIGDNLTLIDSVQFKFSFQLNNQTGSNETVKTSIKKLAVLPQLFKNI